MTRQPMPFDGYYRKIYNHLGQVESLEQLIVWRKRVNIGNAGLPYKTKDGYLSPHRYHTFKDKRQTENT
ncbi:hypothetical protein [Vibrio parahaemolyticus]